MNDREFVIHKGELNVSDDDDPQTVALLRDLVTVMFSVHQGMPVYGPWFEERIRHIISQKLPSRWMVSGPSQVFDPLKRGIRSRSWDLIIHIKPETPLPVAASLNSGFPLLPAELVAVVIDTKTMFTDVAGYAASTVFNIRNDCEISQIEFLGRSIAKIILSASSTKNAQNLFDIGRRNGLSVFALSRTKTGPVSDYEERTTDLKLQQFTDGTWPLIRFFELIEQSISNYESKGV